MKTKPRLCLCMLFLALVASLSGAATDAFAQGAAKETSSTGKDGRAATAPSPAYDLEIKDGLLLWNGAKRKDNASRVPANLQNVVGLLRELHPEANFALSPGLADMVIGDLKMRTSSVSSVEEQLEAIRIASRSEFLWRTYRGPVRAVPDQPNPPLYVLEAIPATEKPGLQVEAFNIGGYLHFLSDDDYKGDKAKKLNAAKMEQIERMVLETVKEYEVVNQVANPKAKSLRPPSIKFHTGANLAIIIGEPEAVAVAAKVIGALPGAQRSVTNAPQR